MRLFYFAGFDIGSTRAGCADHVEGAVRGLHKLGWDIVLFSCRDLGNTKEPVFPFKNILISRKSPQLKHQVTEQFRLLWKLLFLREKKPDAIYIRNRLTMLAPVIYARLRRIPYFYEINAKKEFETSHKSLIKIAHFIENRVIRGAAGIFCVTEQLRDYFANRAKVDVSRFEVISNAADPGIWTGNERPMFKKADSSSNIGFLGTFQDRQGVETIIKILPRIRESAGNVCFLIAGSGPRKDFYEQLSKELNVAEHIQILDYLLKENIGSFLSSIDVAVAPYTLEFAKTGTGLSPLKVFTYLACERMVVASDLEDLKDCRDCPAVVFARPDDLDDFAQKIVEVLKLPLTRRNELGKLGRQYIIEHYTWDDIAGKTANSILKFIGSKKEN